MMKPLNHKRNTTQQNYSFLTNNMIQENYSDKPSLENFRESTYNKNKSVKFEIEADKSFNEQVNHFATSTEYDSSTKEIQNISQNNSKYKSKEKILVKNFNESNEIDLVNSKTRTESFSLRKIHKVKLVTKVTKISKSNTYNAINFPYKPPISKSKNNNKSKNDSSSIETGDSITKIKKIIRSSTVNPNVDNSVEIRDKVKEKEKDLLTSNSNNILADSCLLLKNEECYLDHTHQDYGRIDLVENNMINWRSNCVNKFYGFKRDLSEPRKSMVIQNISDVVDVNNDKTLGNSNSLLKFEISNNNEFFIQNLTKDQPTENKTEFKFETYSISLINEEKEKNLIQKADYSLENFSIYLHDEYLGSKKDNLNDERKGLFEFKTEHYEFNLINNENKEHKTSEKFIENTNNNPPDRKIVNNFLENIFNNYNDTTTNPGQDFNFNMKTDKKVEGEYENKIKFKLLIDKVNDFACIKNPINHNLNLVNETDLAKEDIVNVEHKSEDICYDDAEHAESKENNFHDIIKETLDVLDNRTETFQQKQKPEFAENNLEQFSFITNFETNNHIPKNSLEISPELNHQDVIESKGQLLISQSTKFEDQEDKMQKGNEKYLEDNSNYLRHEKEKEGNPIESISHNKNPSSDLEITSNSNEMINIQQEITSNSNEMINIQQTSYISSKLNINYENIDNNNISSKLDEPIENINDNSLKSENNIDFDNLILSTYDNVENYKSDPTKKKISRSQLRKEKIIKNLPELLKEKEKVEKVKENQIDTNQIDENNSQNHKQLNTNDIFRVDINGEIIFNQNLRQIDESADLIELKEEKEFNTDIKEKQTVEDKTSYPTITLNDKHHLIETENNTSKFDKSETRKFTSETIKSIEIIRKVKESNHLNQDKLINTSHDKINNTQDSNSNGKENESSNTQPIQIKKENSSEINSNLKQIIEINKQVNNRYTHEENVLSNNCINPIDKNYIDKIKLSEKEFKNLNEIQVNFNHNIKEILNENKHPEVIETVISHDNKSIGETKKCIPMLKREFSFKNDYDIERAPSYFDRTNENQKNIQFFKISNLNDKILEQKDVRINTDEEREYSNNVISSKNYSNLIQSVTEEIKFTSENSEEKKRDKEVINSNQNENNNSGLNFKNKYNSIEKKRDIISSYDSFFETRILQTKNKESQKQLILNKELNKPIIESIQKNEDNDNSPYSTEKLKLENLKNFKISKFNKFLTNLVDENQTQNKDEKENMDIKDNEIKPEKQTDNSGISQIHTEQNEEKIYETNSIPTNSYTKLQGIKYEINKKVEPNLPFNKNKAITCIKTPDLNNYFKRYFINTEKSQENKNNLSFVKIYQKSKLNLNNSKAVKCYPEKLNNTQISINNSKSNIENNESIRVTNKQTENSEQSRNDKHNNSVFTNKTSNLNDTNKYSNLKNNISARLDKIPTGNKINKINEQISSNYRNDGNRDILNESRLKEDVTSIFSNNISGLLDFNSNYSNHQFSSLEHIDKPLDNNNSKFSVIPKLEFNDKSGIHRILSKHGLSNEDRVNKLNYSFNKTKSNLLNKTSNRPCYNFDNELKIQNSSCQSQEFRHNQLNKSYNNIIKNKYNQEYSRQTYDYNQNPNHSVLHKRMNSHDYTSFKTTSLNYGSTRIDKSSKRIPSLGQMNNYFTNTYNSSSYNYKKLNTTSIPQIKQHLDKNLQCRSHSPFDCINHNHGNNQEIRQTYEEYINHLNQIAKINNKTSLNINLDNYKFEFDHNVKKINNLINDYKSNLAECDCDINCKICFQFYLRHNHYLHYNNKKAKLFFNLKENKELIKVPSSSFLSYINSKDSLFSCHSFKSNPKDSSDINILFTANKKRINYPVIYPTNKV